MPAVGGRVSVVGARLVDITPYGMMIETPVALTEDAVLSFRLSVEGRKADVSARVATCRSRPGERHAFGVGLEFLDLAPDLRDAIRDALARQASHPATT